MQRRIEYLVNRMLQANIISREDKEWYVYSIQIIFEKIISVSSILFLAIIFGYFFQTVGFLLVFSGIRRYAGGFHLKHFGSCYLFSVGTYLFFVLAIQRFQTEFTIIQMIIIFIIVLFMLCIGAVNNQEFRWSIKEEIEKSVLTRYSILIIYCVFVGLKLSGIDDSYLWFMGFGLSLSFCGLILQKINIFKNKTRV